MPSPFPELFDFKNSGPDRFLASGPETKWRRVYGGLVVSQALAAAMLTVEPDKIVHSMHCYFLLPGDTKLPIAFEIDRLRDGSARLVKKPGQVFNRIHVEDAVAGFFASMARPHPGRAYTLADDEPAAADVVIMGAAKRLGLPLPPEVSLDDPSVSDAMRRFYNDSKRLSNARAKAELGWRPKYPTWREGIESLLPTRN